MHTNNVNVVKELIAAKADVNARDKDDLTVLINACMRFGKSLDILRRLMLTDVNERRLC